MKKTELDWRIIICGIIALTMIECVALFKGIDGVLLSSIIGIIALAIGITIPNPISGGK